MFSFLAEAAGEAGLTNPPPRRRRRLTHIKTSYHVFGILQSVKTAACGSRLSDIQMGGRSPAR